jgi:hypothetical protein
MIRKILLAMFLGTSLMLAGCPATLQVHPVPTAEDIKNDPVLTLQHAINQGNANVAAYGATVLKYRKEGLISFQTKEQYADVLDTVRDDIKKAEKALEVGDLAEAGLKQALFEGGLEYIRKELAKLAAEEANDAR